MARPPVPTPSAHGTTAEKLLVATYRRVSSKTQVDGMGLEIQSDLINAYLKNHPLLQVVESYEDAGFTGSSLNRPALQKLFADAKEHRFTQLLIGRYDRLSRDLFNALLIERTLTMDGVSIVSVSESLNGGDHTVKAMRRVLQVFGELDKCVLVSRLSKGRQKLIDAGLFAGGTPALGWRVHDSRLVPDPKEIPTVQRLFRLRMGRHSLKAIADKLNAEGHRTKSGRLFSAPTVLYVLRNERCKQLISQGKRIKSADKE